VSGLPFFFIAFIIVSFLSMTTPLIGMKKRVVQAEPS